MKLKKYIMTIGVVSALALSVVACSNKADTTASQSANAGERVSADNKESSTEETRTIAYD